MVRIQRDFLWGVVGGGNKISWGKWDTVCTQKSKGGLGGEKCENGEIKLTRKMEMEVITRRPWSLEGCFMEKYGRNTYDIAIDGREAWPTWASKWWKDLVRLKDGDEQPWFTGRGSAEGGEWT